MSWDSLSGLWENTEWTNICIIGILEGEDREKGTESLFKEIIAENIPGIGKETDIQGQEAKNSK